MKTTLPSNLPGALRRLRRACRLSQEAFADVSGRTYLSELERGVKDPTFAKLEQLAAVMKVHPLALFVLAYSDGSSEQVGRLLAQVEQEVRAAVKAEND